MMQGIVQGRLVAPVRPDDHAQGPPDARVVLIEYGDYECPYCQAAHRVVKRVQEEYADDLLFVFRHFPLGIIHPNAYNAACAAEAAGMQDRFWEMHDRLFLYPNTLSLPELFEHARQIGLDLEQFEADLRSPATLARVREDVRMGVRSGVNGTPTFFVNGMRHNGMPTVEALEATIEEALEEA